MLGALGSVCGLSVLGSVVPWLGGSRAGGGGRGRGGGAAGPVEEDDLVPEGLGGIISSRRVVLAFVVFKKVKLKL